jgi:hypothetical protein
VCPTGRPWSGGNERGRLVHHSLLADWSWQHGASLGGATRPSDEKGQERFRGPKDIPVAYPAYTIRAEEGSMGVRGWGD